MGVMLLGTVMAASAADACAVCCSQTCLCYSELSIRERPPAKHGGWMTPRGGYEGGGGAQPREAVRVCGNAVFAACQP